MSSWQAIHRIVSERFGDECFDVARRNGCLDAYTPDDPGPTLNRAGEEVSHLSLGLEIGTS